MCKASFHRDLHAYVTGGIEPLKHLEPHRPRSALTHTARRSKPSFASIRPPLSRKQQPASQPPPALLVSRRSCARFYTCSGCDHVAWAYSRPRRMWPPKRPLENALEPR
jgi:hypothetical protein